MEEGLQRNILVLSATGNVGRPLVKALLHRGGIVKAASRHPIDSRGIEHVYFDFKDSSTFLPSFEGVDAVYMMLPTGYTGGIKALLPLIDIAASQNVKVVLQTAIEATYDKSSPHIPVEDYLKKSCSKYVILRPTWFMDNFHIFWAHDIKRGFLRLPAGDGKTAFIAIKDVADCACAVLLSDDFNKGTINLTGGEALSYGEVAKVFTTELRRRIIYEPVSTEEYVTHLVESGMSRQPANFFADAISEVSNGRLGQVYDDAQRIMGKPPRTLAEYIVNNKQMFLPSDA